MATVYRAHCTLLDRTVAVKILKEEYCRDQNFVLKFKSEAQAVARLSHPNIVNVYDVGEDQGMYFIVMEYVEGITLKEYIERKGPLPPGEMVRITSMICDALAVAHDKGVIHRDIKPQNILITADGSVKVTDFGIARAASNMTITYSGHMVGSVHYVSPEQARGDPVDKRSDIYSLGCVMYEMVTGRVPYDADSPVTVALKHMHEEPKPPRLLNESISKEMETVILTAMEKNPAYRYQSVQQLKQDLYDALYGKGNARRQRRHDKTIIMPNIGGEETQMRTRRKVRPVVYAVLALLGLLLGIYFSGSLWGLLFGEEVTVPNVVNLSLNEAKEILDAQGLGLTVINRIYSESVEQDHIISQDPKPNEKVKKGRKIGVVLSLGAEKVEVPRLIGKNQDDIRIILLNEGLELGQVDKIDDPDVPEGVVISQEPAPGKKVPVGSQVDVTVSTGKEKKTIIMPNLIGSNLDDARSSLESIGLTLGQVDQQDSDRYFPGRIISQSVPAGQLVESGQEISVVISKGPGPYPKTAHLEFTMPENSDYAVLSVVLTDAKGTREIYNNTHIGGYTFSRDIEYYDKGEVVFYVDGQPQLKQVLQ